MTNPIYAYGEDSMTLGLLQNNNILKGEGFEIDLTKAEIFYRPSFGRGCLHGFGEFDAIIIEQGKVYLVESKWRRGNEEVKLSTSQKKRHTDIREYYERYKKTKFNWGEFARLNKLPKKESLLYRNMEIIFRKFSESNIEPNKIFNLLIVFQNSTKKIDKPKGFELIKIDSKQIEKSNKGWVELKR